MDKLSEIICRCKCGVFVSINEHRDYYESVESKLADLDRRECPPEIDDDVRAKMIKRDTIIQIQAYPDTPIGSYVVFHWDLDSALSEMLECLIENEGR